MLSKAFEECWERTAENRFAQGWVAKAIEARNVAGLCDQRRANLYPADLETVVAAAARLGLGHQEARARAPLLRSPTSFAQYREQRARFLEGRGGSGER